MVVNKLMIDIAAGPDLGFCIGTYEKTSAATIVNGNITPDIYRHRTVIDLRSRIQLTAWYKKLGLLLGYSFGMHNYYRTGDDKEAFSRFLRTGISYRLK